MRECFLPDYLTSPPEFGVIADADLQDEDMVAFVTGCIAILCWHPGGAGRGTPRAASARLLWKVESLTLPVFTHGPYIVSLLQSQAAIGSLPDAGEGFGRLEDDDKDARLREGS